MHNRRGRNKTSKRRGGIAANRYLEKEQVKALKQYLRKQRQKAKGPGRIRAAINEMLVDVLVNTGLRPIELCRLQMRDLPHCHQKKSIEVREGKGSVKRTVMISTKLTQRLSKFVKSYRSYAKPTSPLFTNERGTALSYWSLYSKIKIIGRKVGIELTPYIFRHTYGMMYYRRHKDLFGLADQLGHADPMTTHIYARTSAHEMRQQVEELDL